MPEPAVLPRATLDALREAAHPLIDGEAGDYDRLLKLIADARLVLLGVSSNGTHELFRARVELTKRLIHDSGFTAVALGADSAAVQPIDTYVRGASPHTLACDALAELTGFPKWTWRNAELLDFIGWLRTYNDLFPREINKVGMYGIESADAIDALMARLSEKGRPARTVIWAHNRQVGDARATDGVDSSLGQLARERYGRWVVLVSFSTYGGTIVASSDPRGAPRRVRLQPPPADSVEGLCHAVEIPRFYVALRGAPEPLAAALREPRLERMLEAVYRPDSEGLGTYVQVRLMDQFDALIHFDETRSLEPLDSSGSM
jgi:erythromycin esterase-like protein